VRRLVALGCVALLAACTRPARDAGVIAVFSGGEIRLDEVERELTATLGRQQATAGDDPVSLYQQVAEAMVCERTLVPGELDMEAVRRELGDEFEAVQRSAVLELFTLLELEPVRVEPADVERYYNDHLDGFFRGAQRYVWHLYRRHAGAERPEATSAFVEQVRRRALGGESFESLAREYSDSETRQLGGRLGWIGRGELPAELEGAVFALAKGEISAPLPVRGGVALFLVTEVVSEKQMPLDDVRLWIQGELVRRSRMEQIRQLLGDSDAPEGSLVLGRDQLLQRLSGGSGTELVMDIAGQRMTVREFLELARERGLGVPGVPLLERDPEDLYQELLTERLLYRHAVDTGFTARPEVEEALAARLDAAARDQILAVRIKEAIWQEIDRRPDELEAFYESNRFLYQSPLGLKLRMLSVPVKNDPSGVLAGVEAAREALVAGRIDLPEAARQVGGEIVHLGWLTVPQLERIEPRFKAYVLGVGSTGYTVPFQRDRKLNIIEVMERREPAELPFTEVRDRVREDFFARHQQALYQDVTRRVLEQAEFRFFEDRVREALDRPAPGFTDD